MSIKLVDASVIKPMLGSTALAVLDTISAVNINFDFMSQVANLSVPVGALTNGQFSPSQATFPLMIMINLVTGAYTSSNTSVVAAGTLTAAQLAAWQSLANSVRTQIEQTLVADGVIPGTQQNP